MRSDKYLDSTMTIWCLTMSNWWLCATSGECAMSGSSSTVKPTSFRARNGNLWHHHIIWVTRRGLGSAVTVFKSSRSQVRKLLRDLFVTTDRDHWANIGLWRSGLLDCVKSLERVRLWPVEVFTRSPSSRWEGSFFSVLSSKIVLKIACWKGWKKSV